jgi:2-dehydropantoate 2-reductase
MGSNVAGAPRVLVVGIGGIGGIVCASLLDQGHDVAALSRNAYVADAVNAHGFRTRGELALGVVAGHVRTELSKKAGPFDYVLLCTQPNEVEAAARASLPFLGEGGALVCLQNGLCEPLCAAIAGPERVLGAIVAWGASMIEPGVFDRTSAGGFVLGRLGGDASADARLERLAALFECIGPVTLTDNLLGARWSKLAINCAISSLGAIGGERLGILLGKRFVRRLALEIMTEAVDVARAEGARLEKVAGTIDLDWIALTPGERAASLGSPSLVAKHALLLAVGARYRRLRSSMLAAIERGREPPIDFLNGEVVKRAGAHGLAVPVNASVVAAVRAVAARRERASLAALERLYRATSAVRPNADAPASTDAASAPAGDTVAEEPLAAPAPAAPTVPGEPLDPGHDARP